MSTWWAALAERDQRILRIGGALLVLLLGYTLLWEPARAQREQWRQRAVAADQSLAWMRAAAPHVQTQPAAVVNDGRSLLARVDLGAREAGLGGVLLRVEPISPTQVRVFFEAAPFDRLMEWLQPLSETHGLRVDELSLQRADGVGLVNLRFTLTQPGV